MSDKLGPAVRKQKINTFKLLSNAQVPQCDTYWIITQEVKSSNPIGVYFSCFVCFFFCQETIYGKAVFVFLFPVSNKISADKVKHVMTKVHQQRINQTSKQEKQQTG